MNFLLVVVFLFKQKTAFDLRISDWSSDVCSSDLVDHEVGAARAGAVAPRAGGAALRFEMLGVAEVDKRVEAGDGFEDDVAALAAVAAVGAAIFDIFLEIGRASCRDRGWQYV